VLGYRKTNCSVPVADINRVPAKDINSPHYLALRAINIFGSGDVTVDFTVSVIGSCLHRLRQRLQRLGIKGLVDF
jgi:hypothetical protein